jgi:hypothetical protein
MIGGDGVGGLAAEPHLNEVRTKSGERENALNSRELQARISCFASGVAGATNVTPTDGGVDTMVRG